jgi:hypothetical protein
MQRVESIYTTREQVRDRLLAIDGPAPNDRGLYEAAKAFFSGGLLIDGFANGNYDMRHAYVVLSDIQPKGGWLKKKYEMTIRGVGAEGRIFFFTGVADIQFGENLSGHFGGYVGDFVHRAQRVSYRFTHPDGVKLETHARCVAQDLLDIANGSKPTFR